MKQIVLTLTILFFIATASAQLLSWSPQFANENATITITLDANKGNQSLLGYTGTVYMHLGLITNLSTSPTDWKYVSTTWASTTAPTATSLGNNKWSFTITKPRTYFNAGAGGVPAGETILKVAVLFRDAAGNLVQKNTDLTDMFVPIYVASGNYVQFTNPLIVPTNTIANEAVTATINQSFTATAVASSAAGTLNMYFNTIKIAGPLTGTSTITANPTITATGNQQIVSELIIAGVSYYDTINFYISPIVVTAPLPAGAIEGINYNANCSSVTLVLFAPNKTNAMVLGDFSGSNWASQSAFQMNRTPDGNYYWLTINGLTSGTEYAYQYLVDNSIYIADPYSEKILDPNNDQFIPAATYPGLKPYPVNANVSASQNGFVSVLQPCAPAYNWKVTNFVKPDKRNLITYELLVRDFGDARNYQMLIDTIGYFKRLGINAIEFMPVSEFTGNDSWGYNPTFYCALDKAYGTKNKFKELIDLCHQNGIAVLLDVVYNQMDAVSNPQGKLYWDAANNRPASNSPWFNQAAPHPYSVFNDLNHTSTATQYLVERSLDYWLSEYKVDGFRFDLAKGFTQTQTDGTTVENYDASRVANINRYYDHVIANYPDTYMILEFLGQQRQEEQAYATKGFMLWGNNNPAYNQNTMGFASNSDFSKIVYNSNSESFTTPAEMGYMESHDEERLMYKNLQYGNNAGTYNVKTLATALDRQAAAAALFFTVPGPKMIWQFGERGYDIPIDFISRVAAKPPHWEYMADVNRLKLWNSYASLINLRLSNPAVFNNPVFTYDFNDNNGLVKRFQIADTASAGSKITVIANMDVTPQTRTIIFQTSGNWNNYLSNGSGTGINGLTNTTFNIANATQSITLQPGEYHVFKSVPACATTSPTVTASLSYCRNATAASLSATGTNLLWYTVATGGTGVSAAPTPATSTIGSTIYYVTQTANSCEGPRAAITVNVTENTPLPSVNTPVNYCQNSASTALTATGTNLVWYTTATGGTGNSAAPIPSTASVGNTIYYVSQTQSCGEGGRASITVTVNAVPAAPVVSSPVIYCQNATATALSANGTGLLWYTTANGGTGSSTSPVPLTSVSSTYYVSQTNNGCESARSSIAVNITQTPSSPMVTTPVAYCQNATAAALTATGSNLLWYTNAIGGTGSATSITPSTSTGGTILYYVSQTANGCEGLRAAISVNITALPLAPAVTAALINYCQNEAAAILSATGTNLLWYTTVTGGTGNSAAPTPSTIISGATNFYVSQSNTCGESARTLIIVNVTTTPLAPTGLNIKSTTLTNATVSWNLIAGTFYTVDFKPAATSTWNNVITSSASNSVTINNLTMATTYDWRVSANCAATPTTNFTVAQFTTSSRNNSITHLKSGFGLKLSPNPVNSDAVLDYLIPGSGTVNISLYNSLGQRVQILFSGTQSQGQYQLNLVNQLSGLNTGNYFIKLEQNESGYYIQFIKR